MLIFSFDVESIGLHGEGFAVGGATFLDGVETNSFLFSVPSAIASGTNERRKWVAENIPSLPITHNSLAAMRSDFWKLMVAAKDNGAEIVTDCGWPVEANFLSDCVADDLEARQWQGPFPLLDLTSALVVCGIDPLTTFNRQPNELPKHNPLCDARQSARIWIENVR